MKRFLFPLGLTLALHGLFLVAEGDWSKKRISHRQRPVPIALTLGYLEPIKPVFPREKWLQKPPSAPSPQKKSDDIHNKSKSIKEKPKKKHVKLKPPKKTKKTVKPKTTKKPKKIEPIIKPAKPHLEPPPPRPPLSTPEWIFEIPEEGIKEYIDTFPGTTEELPQEEIPLETEVTVSRPPVQKIRDAIPIYRQNPPPQYPRVARRRGYQGTVVLEVLVNREGRVKKLRVFQSSGYSVLDNSAISSVKGWLFEPGRRGDEKVEMWVKLPVRFELKE